MAAESYTTITTVNYPKHAQLLFEGVKAAYPTYTFRVVQDSVTSRVEVLRASSGLRVCDGSMANNMERFAAGFYAALKAHCSL